MTDEILEHLSEAERVYVEEHGDEPAFRVRGARGADPDAVEALQAEMPTIREFYTDPEYAEMREKLTTGVVHLQADGAFSLRTSTGEGGSLEDVPR